MEAAQVKTSLLTGNALRVLDKILYSEWYLAAVNALVLLFWATEAMISGFVIMCLILSAVLVLKRDVTPCIPIIISIYCIICKGEFPPYFGYMFFILIPVIGALVFHFVYYPVRKPTAGKFGLAYLAVAASMFMGGAFTDATTDRLKGLAFAAFLGLFPFAIYAMVTNYKVTRGRDFVIYVSKALAFLGIMIVLQLLVRYVRVWTGVINDGEVHLGWGISNGAATVLLLTAPVTMYVSVTCKKQWSAVLYLLASVMQYVGVVATVSRGAILFGAVTFVLTIVASLVAADKKRRIVYAAIYCAALVIAAICCAVLKDKLIEFFDKAFETGLSVSGRDVIYAEAWEMFKQNPLFGVGFGYVGVHAYLNRNPMYYFHSTFFQTIASLGLFGTVASVYMYCKRIKLAFSKGTAFNLFWIVACVGIEGYAMINTFTFLAVPGLLLIAIATVTNEESNYARSLDDLRQSLVVALSAAATSAENKLSTQSNEGENTSEIDTETKNTQGEDVCAICAGREGKRE